MAAKVEASRETTWPVRYPPTVDHHLGRVVVFAARRWANHRCEGCMRVSASASALVGRPALSDKWRAEPRSEPDSGNPTVRDRRAALRNVTSHAITGGSVRALNFEPDNRTYGLKGGWGTGSARTPRP